jgi:hypothetical protein
MSVSQVRSGAVSARPHSGVSAADLKTAAKLKPAVLDVLKRVRFGNPLPAAQCPKPDAKGEWRAPNGDRLIEVKLSTPPPGMMDGMSSSAFVNPKTNQFYSGEFGGIAGLHNFHGPMALPKGTEFHGKTFSAADISALTAAANGKAPSGKIPTKAQILGAMGAFEFHKMLRWGAKGPAASDVLKTVPLEKSNHPDGYNYTGLVLKSDPNKVVIKRTGGFAGLTQYSQPLDTTRLPK